MENEEKEAGNGPIFINGTLKMYSLQFCRIVTFFAVAFALFFAVLLLACLPLLLLVGFVIIVIVVLCLFWLCFIERLLISCKGENKQIRGVNPL